MKLLSVVVPCYNEQEAMRIFYDEIIKVADQMKNDVNFEVIFVDDGSKDDTLKVARELSEKDDRIKYVSFSRNFGKESAIYAGLEKAKGDFVATMDVDLQDPPKLLVDMSQTDKYGIYHVTNSGYCRRTELTKYIFNISNSKCKVNEITSDEVLMHAQRPKNSRLSNKSLVENNFEILPKWEDSIKEYIEELEKSKV